MPVYLDSEDRSVATLRDRHARSVAITYKGTLHGVATTGSVVVDGDGPQRAMKSVEVTGPVDSVVPATEPDHPNDG